jgi:hypothetical protein
MRGFIKKSTAVYISLALIAIMGGWYFYPNKSYASFSYYKSITIDYTKVSTNDQSNFPIEYDVTDANLATVANGGHVQNASGFDIGFYTSSDCSTGKLNWETEVYSATTGRWTGWIKISSLSHTVDTVIYLCYGDASISTDQSSASSVWDSDYMAVWHLNQNAGTKTLTDSTSHANTMNNNVNTSLRSITGKTGDAIWFNGSSDFAKTASTPSYTANTAGTVSAWVYASTSIADGAEWWYTGQAGSNSNLHGSTWNAGNVRYNIRVKNAGDVINTGDTGGSTYPTGSWYYVVWESDTGSTNSTKLYMNGNDKSGFLAATTAAWFSSISSISATELGRRDIASPDSSWKGILDEVRVSDIKRGSDWITTEYNNQSATSTFYTVGSENTITATTTQPPILTLKGGYTVFRGGHTVIK